MWSRTRRPDVLVRCDGRPREKIVEIDQSQPAVHLYRRGADGTWTLEAATEMDAVLHLRGLGLDLPLAEIYEEVDFADSE